MATSLTTDVAHGGGRPPGNLGGGGGGGGRGPGGGGSEGPGWQRRASFTGLWVILAAIVMFFAAFTSAFVVRRGISADWGHTPLPGIVWWNTGVLLASSGLLELARRSLRLGRRAAFNRYWTAGTALGVAFLAIQVVAWEQLKAAGVYVSTNPSAAFFYIFTAAHAAHLLGGVVALIYVNVQALRLRLGPGKRTGADLSAIYWHFLDGLWLYLVAMLHLWG